MERHANTSSSSVQDELRDNSPWFLIKEGGIENSSRIQQRNEVEEDSIVSTSSSTNYDVSNEYPASGAVCNPPGPKPFRHPQPDRDLPYNNQRLRHSSNKSPAYGTGAMYNPPGSKPFRHPQPDRDLPYNNQRLRHSSKKSPAYGTGAMYNPPGPKPFRHPQPDCDLPYNNQRLRHSSNKSPAYGTGAMYNPPGPKPFRHPQPDRDLPYNNQRPRHSSNKSPAYGTGAMYNPPGPKPFRHPQPDRDLPYNNQRPRHSSNKSPAYGTGAMYNPPGPKPFRHPQPDRDLPYNNQRLRHSSNKSPAYGTGAMYNPPGPKPFRHPQPDHDLPYNNQRLQKYIGSNNNDMQRKPHEERQLAEEVDKIISKADELDQLMARMKLVLEREARNVLDQISTTTSPEDTTVVKFITRPTYFDFTPMTQEEFKKRHNDGSKKKLGATFDRVAAAPAQVAAVFQKSEVSLPCEFCAKLVPADELVLHETGCRPDLTQHMSGVLSQNGPPLIPCEFCLERLPVHLITDHQNNCQIKGGSN